ncbi:MAG: hypothetical protein AAF432_09765 [Planctomycetota bacterium]
MRDQSTITCIGLLTTIAILAGTAAAETVTTLRESDMTVSIFAGSGPVANTTAITPESTSLTDAFVHSIDDTIFGEQLDRPSGVGSATSRATVDRSDVLTYSASGGLMRIDSSASNFIEAEYLTGFGTCTSTANQFLVIEFDVVDDPVTYDISGLLLPTNELGQIILRQTAPFPAIVYRFTSVLGDSGPYANQGVLPPGSYQLDVDLQSFALANSIVGPVTTETAEYVVALELGCRGDSTGNGVVNIDDLLDVINEFGGCEGNCPDDPCPADINGNCAVNVDDLLDVINAFGAVCP